MEFSVAQTLLRIASAAERFEVRRELGAGGMGVVCEAFDKQEGRTVALKTLRPGDERNLLRLKHEFRALSGVHHPNLVTLYELLSIGDEVFFTMELIEGVPLLAWLGVEGADEPDPQTAPTVQLPGATTPEPRHRRTSGGVPRYDPARLRDALRQLAEGVAALHEAGILHRDLKPSNVLVTAEGRLVLLDFGLATALAGDRFDGHDVLAGTIDYMSPEQAAREPLGPPSDWYAFGVILYRVLTGRMPFLGGVADVLQDKQRFEPPPPAEVAAGVPDDLAALAGELLRLRPEARPTGTDVLRRLGSAEAASAGGSRSTSGVPVFVGRTRELALLEGALADAREGTVLVQLSAQSGVGKSALEQRFLERVEAEGALVLQGRCYEREHVPYKALDAVVDQLSQYLARLPRAEADALVPADASALARVFTVLRQVDAIAEAPRVALAGLGSHGLRLRAFGALRELLMRLALTRSLVIALDDLQWGDADGGALLASLVRPPDAPAMLVLLCARAEEQDGAFFSAFEAHAQGALLDRRALALGPLAEAESVELAATLLGSADPGQVRARRIAAEAGGSPFFIGQLARYTRDEPGGQTPTLETLLRLRLLRLPDEALRLLRVIAVAGRPLAQAVAMRAADVEGPGALALLKAGSLVRARGGAEPRVEAYHDRIREAAQGLITPEELPHLHGRLARALEAIPDADPEALALHLRGAGDDARAAELAIRAADRAAEALAFAREAQLLRLAIELSPDDRDALRALRVRRGHALSNAGRGREASTAFLEASEGAPSAERLDLRRRAAEELLRAGHLEEGRRLLDTVLEAFGAPLARTRGRALASLVLRRTMVRVRGLGWKPRDESQIPREDLARIDLGYAVATGLGMVDHILAADFAARHLIATLRAGEPLRIQRALAAEAALRSLAGKSSLARCEAVLGEMDRIAEQLGTPTARALAIGVRGIVSFNVGRVREALALSSEAAALFRERCPGYAWELGTAHMFVLFGLSLVGEMDEVSVRLPALLEEAEARGDLYNIVNLRTACGYLPYLIRDDALGGHVDLDDVIARWPARTFQFPHFNAAVSHAYLDIMAGFGAAALERLDRCGKEIRSGGFLRVQTLRVSLSSARLRAHLVEHERGGKPEHLAAAAVEARRLEREGVEYASALATLGRAAIAYRSGDEARALRILSDAEAACEDVSFGLYAIASRRRRGQLLGGDEGRAMVDACDRLVRAQRFKSLESFYRLWAPGFDEPGTPQK